MSNLVPVSSNATASERATVVVARNLARRLRGELPIAMPLLWSDLSPSWAGFSNECVDEFADLLRPWSRARGSVRWFLLHWNGEWGTRYFSNCAFRAGLKRTRDPRSAAAVYGATDDAGKAEIVARALDKLRSPHAWAHYHYLVHTGSAERLPPPEVSVNRRFGSGEYLFNLAAAGCSLEFLRFLFERGADARSVNFDGVTALHEAASFQSMRSDLAPILDFLLSLGLNIDAQDIHGLTPLHYAANRDQAIWCQLLLDRGADPTITANDGQRASDFAKPEDNSGARAMLEQKCLAQSLRVPARTATSRRPRL